jgi:hypothetical protein
MSDLAGVFIIAGVVIIAFVLRFFWHQSKIKGRLW